MRNVVFRTEWPEGDGYCLKPDRGDFCGPRRCMLPKGHVGEHECPVGAVGEGAAFILIWPDYGPCPAVREFSMLGERRCRLPEGHAGPHEAELGLGMDGEVRWRDDG